MTTDREVICFDLARGTVVAPGGTRAAVVPMEVLAELVASAAPLAVNAAAREMGAAMGSRAAERLGGAEAVGSAPLPDVVDALGRELSIAGLGAFAVEQWGRAMVLVLENAPALDRGFVAAVLEGAIEAATGRPARCLTLATTPVLRVLVAGDAAVSRVRGWLAGGVGWAESLARLQQLAGTDA